MQSPGFKNVWLLTFANALAFSATPMVLLIGGLVGLELTSSAHLATLPLAMIIMGAATGVIPASILMKKYGRKSALLFYVGVAAAICWLASYSLAIKSFFLFNGACFLLGVTNAAFQQIRFAAMESVSPDESPKAASMIMSGGIIAAILGPEIAVFGRELTGIDYQGSFYLVSLLFCLAAVILMFFHSAPIVEPEKQKPARPLTEILNNANFWLAVASAVVGFFIMSFIMTGTPMSMHNHLGYSLTDTKWVIQSHIIAMFLPSLIAPALFNRFGIRRVMAAGLALYSLTILVGSFFTSVWGFWIQLVFLGVGWNFLFLSGTALLPSTYRPGEQYKAQAFNDSLVFSMQAIAALTAGAAIAFLSWGSILLLCLIPMSILLALLIRTKSTVIPQ